MLRSPSASQTHSERWHCAPNVTSMFVCTYVFLAHVFVRLSGTGVHCDHTAHFSVDLSLRLDSLMLWTP